MFVAIKGLDGRVKVKFYYGSLRLLRVRVNIFVQMVRERTIVYGKVKGRNNTRKEKKKKGEVNS